MNAAYRPHENKPLIQRDSKTFQVTLLIEHDAIEVTVTWELLARDFNRQGTTNISVSPQFIEEVLIEEVYSDTDVFEDRINIKDVITSK